MKYYVEYDSKTEIGSFNYSHYVPEMFEIKTTQINFERTLSKEAFENRRKYIRNLGGTEEETLEYAKFLDYDKPSVAIEKINSLIQNSVDWQQMLNEKIKNGN
jgi:hypothetical protein